jgi:hypothetical protein
MREHYSVISGLLHIALFVFSGKIGKGSEGAEGRPKNIRKKSERGKPRMPLPLTLSRAN